MNTQLLFPTPLWTQKDCGVDRQPIIDFVHYVQKEDPDGRHASNAGGWQSWDFVDHVMLDNPLKPLRDKILECAYYAADQWGFQQYSLKILNLWINVNKKGHFNHMHTHAGSILSGVYYLRIPSCCCGNVTFHQDFNQGMMKESWGCAANFSRYEDMNEIEHDEYPAEDTMLLFPSWLPHSVSASSSGDERISISFNIAAFSDHYHEVYPTR